jgi:ANTAR domain
MTARDETAWEMLDAALADEVATGRDLAASELDRRADGRDRTAHERDVQAGDLDMAALNNVPEDEHDAGFLDRHRSSIDRSQAAGDRTLSRHDREHAALNRLDSAGDRQRAHQDRQHMRQALTSSNVIGQAQGILIRSRGCTADEAFAVLRGMSMQANRKLRDIASTVIEGEIGGS